MNILKILKIQKNKIEKPFKKKIMNIMQMKIN